MQKGGFPDLDGLPISRLEGKPPLQRSLRFRANILEMKEGRSGSNDHIADPSHRELLWSKAMVVSIAETSGRRSRQAWSRDHEGAARV